MEAIRKQAPKLRDQVATQQQAVLKQFGAGLGDSEIIVTYETELQRHQNLEKLYISIVRGVDGYIVTGTKLVPSYLKLEAAETKRDELMKSNMTTLCKEAGAAMAAVEGQQQR